MGLLYFVSLGGEQYKYNIMVLVGSRRCICIVVSFFSFGFNPFIKLL